MSKNKPKVLESEDENEEEEIQANKILGDKQIEASASTDDITPMETRENVKLHVGHLILIRKFSVTPTIKDMPDGTSKVMYITYIDGCLIDNKEVIDKIKSEGVINEKVKDLIRKNCTDNKFYSTSAGIAMSIKQYVEPALKRGAVLTEVATKKSNYPQDMLILKNPFI